MSKKYLDSKAGSIEEISTKIASEQPSIDRTFKADVKLTTEKKYFETKPGSLADAAAKVVSEAMDPVNKDAVKKQFKDRKDKDIDNDGDVDKTDKYLHTRRQAISKNIKEVDNPYAVGMAQAMKSTGDKPPLEKKTIKKAHDIAKGIMKEENFEVTADINFKNARNIVKGAKIVVGAKNKKEAEEKAIDIINNAREKGRWPNPKTGGNFSVDSLQNVKVTPTNKSGGIISKGKENLGAEYMPKEAVKADDKGEVINKKKHDAYKDPKSGEREIIKPIKEGRMKEIAIDMKDLDAEKFKAKYGKSKAEMRKELGTPEKSFADMRKEMMNKTMTGKKVAAVDTEPQSERI